MSTVLYIPLFSRMITVAKKLTAFCLLTQKPYVCISTLTFVGDLGHPDSLRGELLIKVKQLQRRWRHFSESGRKNLQHRTFKCDNTITSQTHNKFKGTIFNSGSTEFSNKLRKPTLSRKITLFKVEFYL